MPPVETREGGVGNDILVLGTLNLGLGCREDDLDVAWVALVGVDATVRTVSAAAGFLRRGQFCASLAGFSNDVREPAERRCS